MLEHLKQRLLTGWTLMRVVRTGLAILIIGQAWNNYDLLFAVLGGILLFQAAFNYGCCSTSGCNINYPKNNSNRLDKAEDVVTFTEVN